MKYIKNVTSMLFIALLAITGSATIVHEKLGPYEVSFSLPPDLVTNETLVLPENGFTKYYIGIKNVSAGDVLFSTYIAVRDYNQSAPLALNESIVPLPYEQIVWMTIDNHPGLVTSSPYSLVEDKGLEIYYLTYNLTKHDQVEGMILTGAWANAKQIIQSLHVIKTAQLPTRRSFGNPAPNWTLKSTGEGGNVEMYYNNTIYEGLSFSWQDAINYTYRQDVQEEVKQRAYIKWHNPRTMY